MTGRPRDREFGFGKLYWRYVAHYAKTHPYEGGWDCEVVEGDEEDWGIDITRCGVCKLHIAMRPPRTSSAGDDRCDFRLKSPPRLTRNQSRD